jgi:hypothetical protein
MKEIILFFLAILFATEGYAQSSSIIWGKEFKNTSGTLSKVEILQIDETGIFIQGGHLVSGKIMYLPSQTYRSGQLIRLDKNNQVVFKRNYDKELKGKFFEEFFLINGKILMIASFYEKSSLTNTLYMCELDKKSGEVMGTWVTLTSMQKKNKDDLFLFKLGYNSDSTHFLVVSTWEGKNKINYSIDEFSDNGKKIGKTIQLSNEFNPETFKLDDLIFTPERKILMVGRNYDFKEGKKSKTKFLEFSNYIIRWYDQEGKKLLDLETEADGIWLNSAKITAQKGKDLMLTAFYSDQKKGQTINGILIQRIDPVTGNVVATKKNAFNFSSLTDPSYDDDAQESEGAPKKKNGESNDGLTASERREIQRLQKLKEESEEFSNELNFTHHFYLEDGGFIFLAEKHFSKYFHSSSSMGMGSSSMTTHTTYLNCYHDDVILCRVNPDCSVSWLKMIPKKQIEMVPEYGLYGYYRNSSSYFNNNLIPYYIGTGATIVGEHLMVYLNDNFRNDAVVGTAQKVRPYKVGKTGSFDEITININNGSSIRKPMFYNKDNKLLMPRLGIRYKNEFILVGLNNDEFARQLLSVSRIVVH